MQPAGIYHRFTPDVNNFAVAVRLFKDEPVWTPYSRSVADTDQVTAAFKQGDVCLCCVCMCLYGDVPFAFGDGVLSCVL